MVPECPAVTLVASLGLAADGYESENRREERIRLTRPLQRCPPGGRLLGGDLAGLHRPVDRSPVELLVDGEPGRPGQADAVRAYSYVTQAGPLEHPEELAADPRVRHRRVQHLRNPAGQRRVPCID